MARPYRTLSKSCHRAGFGLILSLLRIVAPAHADGPISINVAGPPVTVFDTRTQACETIDIPDIAARAFRDHTGTIHLFASHFVSRASIGPTLDTVRHDCHVAFKAGDSDAPSAYDDRQWLSSFFTEDGRTVHALLHSEFEGNRRQPLCPKGTVGACWWNAITAARSTDGGASFQARPAPGNIVAASPYPYQAGTHAPVGYFNPTNIVMFDGAYHAIIWATPFGAQAVGGCPIRTTTLDDPRAWRGWDGSGYTIAFADPYRQSELDPKAHVCTPVGVGQVYLPGGLVRLRRSGRFLLTMRIGAHQGGPAGFYVTTSPDLITWSAPSLIVSDVALASDDRDGTYAYSWPSLIDPAAPDRNFVDVTDHPYLFYIRSDLKRTPYGRALVRRAVVIAR